MLPVFPAWADTVRFSPEHPVPTVLHESDELKVVLVGMEPGQVLPEHPAPAAMFHVLDGTGTVTVDGAPADVGPGATIIAASGTRRGWRARTRLVFLGSLANPGAE
jgi:quercetin dioxygenase-like cupin family protein